MKSDSIHIQRAIRILICLGNRQENWTARMLAEHHGCCIDTVKNIFKHLRACGIRVECSGYPDYYWTLDDSGIVKIKIKSIQRRPAGETHGKARLSDGQVMKLLVDYAQNFLSTAEIAIKYGIDPDYARRLILGKKRRDNPEINAYRATIEIRDERKTFVAPTAKKEESSFPLHFSAFNNESGEPTIEDG